MATQNQESNEDKQYVLRSGPIEHSDRLFNDIATDIYDKYMEIGIELGLQHKVLKNELETGEMKMKQGNKKALQMFDLWKQSVDESDCTYAALAGALEKLRFVRCSHKYCYSSTALDKQNPCTNKVVKDYAKCLKATYRKKSAFPERQWPPTKAREPTKLMIIKHSNHSESEGFTQSSSMKKDYLHDGIDSIEGDKKEIELARILDPVRPPGYPNEPPQAPKVLMDGAPGVGKTTLTRKACIDWANGTLFEGYDIVLLVALREPRYRRAKEIKDFFVVGDDFELKQNVISSIQKSNGKNVLFIFDGYDELSYQQREEESLFLDIIQGDQLPECSVLVTSRPYASDCLKQLPSINRHVEVLGFNKREQIYNCIRRHATKESSSVNLIAELEKREDILSLCYYPLMCIITVYLYEKSGSLPVTMTQVFHDFVLESVKRDVIVTNKKPSVQRMVREVTDLNKFPKSTCIFKRLEALERLAYESLEKYQLTFSYCDLESCLSDSCGEQDDIVMYQCLGLITSLCSFDENANNQYQFFHLSIQEYLAARYASKTLSDEVDQIDLLRQYINIPRFRLFLLFYSGMTNITTENAKMLFCLCRKQYSTIKSSVADANVDICPRKSSVTERDSKSLHEWQKKVLYFIHMIFESKTCNFEMFHLLLEHYCDKNTFCLKDSMITLFDCTLLTHFFTSIDHEWKELDLTNCSLDAHSFLVFSQAYKKCKADIRGKAIFKRIDISQNHPEIVYHLSSFPWLHGVEQLTFKSESDTKCQLKFDEDPPKLKCLSLIAKLDIQLYLRQQDKRLKVILSDSLVSLVSCPAHILGDEFCHKAKQMRIDRLSLKHVDYKTMKCVEPLLLSSKSFEAYEVSTMDVWLCQSSLFSQCEVLSNLSLHHYEFTTSSAVNLFASLACNATIVDVSISGKFQGECEQECVGSSLEQMLSDNACINKLQIEYMLCNELAQFLIAGISKNTTLQVLDVNRNEFSIDTIKRILACVSSNCTTLSTLHISDNVLVKQCDKSWAINNLHKLEMFCAVSQIDQLQCYFSSITQFHISSLNINDATMLVFFQALQCHSFVKKLSIDEGFFDDKLRCNMLRKLLLSNKSIENLTCELSDASSEYLAYILNNNASLKSLTLNVYGQYTCYTNKSIVCILRALQQNKSLKTLKIVSQHGHEMCKPADRKIVGEKFEAVLTNNTSLTEIEMDINDDIAHGIAKGLINNKSLKKLVLSFDSFSTCGAVEVLLSLNSNQQLTYLKINNFCLLTTNSNCEWNLVMEDCHLWYQLKYVLKKESKLKFTTMKIPTVGRLYSVVRTFMETITNFSHYLRVLDLTHNIACIPLNRDNNTVKLIGETFADLLRKTVALKVLNLHQSWLPGGIWSYAKEGLKDNKTLKVLNVSKSDVIVDDVVNILESLENNCTLEELDLSELQDLREATGIACDNLKRAFCRALVSKTSLHTLNLKNSINDDTADAMLDIWHQNANIRKLFLSEQFLSSEIIHKFYMLLSKGQTLTSGFEMYFSELKLLPTSGENLCQYLIDRIMVMEHFYRRSQISYRSPKLFCGLCCTISEKKFEMSLLYYLQELEFKNINSDMVCVVFRTMAHHKPLLRLNKLSIRGTNLSGDEVGYQLQCMLEKDSTLTELTLPTIDNDVAEAIANGLRKNGMLKQMSFTLHPINEYIVKTLLQSITRNVGLIELSIHYNIIPPICRSATSSWYLDHNRYNNRYHGFLPSMYRGQHYCMNFICILLNLRNNTTLSVFERDTIESLLTSLSDFDLSTLQSDTSSTKKLLKSLISDHTWIKLDLSTMNYLMSSGNQQLSDMIEELLSTNMTLESLNLETALNHTTAKGLVKGLKRNKTLMNLHIDGSVLKMETIVEIIDIMNITNLLSLSIKNIFVLRNFESQWQVEVIDETLWPLFLSMLCKASPSMQLLKTMDVLSSLKCIGVGNSFTFDSECKHLSHKTLCYSTKPSLTTITNVLNMVQHLQVLNLSACSISNEDCVSIVPAFANTKQIKELDLSHNSITESGMALVINAVHRELKELEKLDVSYNALSTSEPTPCPLGVALTTLLGTTTSLKVLNLKSCYLSDFLCSCITSGLRNNRTLLSLDISLNNMCILGINVLLNSLDNNFTLKWLNLSETVEILDEHNFIPTFLRSNKTLIDLSICCKFSGNAFMRFITELQLITTLKSLTIDISGQKITNILFILSLCKSGRLDHLNCSGYFSVISTSSGKKLEIYGTNNFNQISQIIQEADIDISNLVISNSSSDVLELNFVNDAFWIKHIPCMLQSLEKNTEVTKLTLIFDDKFSQQSCVSFEALQNLLKVNETINELRLLKNVDDKLAREVMKAIRCSRYLKHVFVDVDQLSNETVIHLLLSIEFTIITKVQLSPVIDISRWDVNSNCWSVQPLQKYIGNFLEFTSSCTSHMRSSQLICTIFSALSELRINCIINETLLISLFSFCEYSPSQIKVLDLSQTETDIRQFGDNVNKALENMIRRNVSIQHLKLGDNINDSIASAIANGLRHNRTLQILEFSVTILNNDTLRELLQTFFNTKLIITCSQQHLKLSRLLTIHSALHSPSNLPVLIQSCTPYVSGNILHNLQDLPPGGLQEIEINTTEHLLSNEFIEDGIHVLLESCKTLKFCNPVTPKVIEDLSKGLKENKTLSTLIINKHGISWNAVSPILRHLYLSAVSTLELIKECVLLRGPDQKSCWTLEVTRPFSSIDEYCDIFHKIYQFPPFVIDSFIRKRPDESDVLSLTRAKTCVTKVIQRSIATGSFYVSELILNFCDKVMIDVKEILKSQTLKTIKVGWSSQCFPEILVKELLLEDFTHSLVSQLDIGGIVSFKRSEEEYSELEAGGNVVYRCKITSSWEAVIKNKLCFGHLYSSLSDTCIPPLSACLRHVPLQSISYIDLSYAQLEHKVLKLIFHKLQKDMNVVYLNLSNCVKTSTGSEDHLSNMHFALLELLKDNKTLQTIDLTGIVSHKLAIEIATVLPLCSLKSLSVNMLSTFDAIEELVCAFISSELNQLRFTDICLLHKDVDSLFIDLNDNYIRSSRQGIVFILSLISRHVPSLKLSLGTLINDEYQLQVFVNQSCQINDDSEFFQSLSELHLETTNENIALFKTVVKSIENCRSLSKLSISYYNRSLVEDENLEESYKHFLLRSKSIKEIHLIGDVSESIIDSIADGLSHSTTMTTLSVSSTILSCDAIANLLQSIYNSRLTCLHVTDSCSIYRRQENCCRVEFTGGKYLHSLLFCASLKTQSCCCLRKALAPNQSLNLSGRSNFPSNLFVYEVLSPESVKESSIKNLNLSSCDLNSDILSTLQLKRSTLQMLNLSHCNMSDGLCGQIADEIALNNKLKVLKLDSNKITIHGVQKLFRSLANNFVLEELDLSDNSFSEITDDSEVNNKMITLNGTLSRLHLGCCDPLCESIAEGLSSRASALTVLSIQIKEEGGIIKIFKSLVNNTSLRELNCAQSSVTTLAGETIQQALANNTKLCHLDLSWCGISDKVCENIASGLAKNRYLKRLNMSGNMIYYSGIVKLFQSLNDIQCSLEELDLSDNCPLEEHSDFNFSELSNALATNTKLKVLNISGLFGYSKCLKRELFKGLQCNRSLEELDTSHSWLDEEATLALSTMLFKNLSISKLTIKWCSFDPELSDSNTIVRAIKSSSSLKTVVCDPRIKTLLQLEGIKADLLDAHIEDAYLSYAW